MDETPVVVATLVPVPGREADLEQKLREAVKATHEQDAGCELYALHRSVRGADRFVIIEKWASSEALGAHGTGAAFAALKTGLDGLLVEPLAATVLEPLPAGEAKLGQL